MAKIVYNTKEEAWKHVQKIFPTEYAKDEEATEYAGYPIYRSTVEGYWWNWICDLGNCLEVNLMDGTTIRVYIAEKEEAEDGGMTDEEALESVNRIKAAKSVGNSISPMFGEQAAIKLTFCVDGDVSGSEVEKKVYEGLRRGDSWLASDLVEAYCNKRQIPWKTITIANTQHYAHGRMGAGHYIIDAIVTI